MKIKESLRGSGLVRVRLCRMMEHMRKMMQLAAGTEEGGVEVVDGVKSLELATGKNIQFF